MPSILTKMSSFVSVGIKDGRLKQTHSHQSGVDPRSKDDKSSATDYRTISLTCILFKDLEHQKASHMVGILTNMSSYMTPNMVLEKQRHARQTELTMLCEDLARITGAGMQTDRIQLDVSRAFDNVNLKVTLETPSVRIE